MQGLNKAFDYKKVLKALKKGAYEPWESLLSACWCCCLTPPFSKILLPPIASR